MMLLDTVSEKRDVYAVRHHSRSLCPKRQPGCCQCKCIIGVQTLASERKSITYEGFVSNTAFTLNVFANVMPLQLVQQTFV